MLELGKTIANDSIGARKQGILEVYKRPGGIVFIASGDGPSGFHSLLGYDPVKKVVVVVFANIFGLFNEKENMLNILDGVLLEVGNATARE